MERDKFVGILEKLDLSAPEARVYLALSELKESKTGELCDKADVASSKVYQVLESLMKKGFVSYRVQNNVKIFMASPPQIIVSLFEEKQARMNEEKREIIGLMNALKDMHSSENPLSKYKYYEGISGIRALWLGLIEDLNTLDKNETILVYTGVKESYEKMLGLYEEFHKFRVKKNIRYRIIYPLDEKEVSKRRKKQLAEVRFMDLKNEAEFAVVGNKIIIQYITGKTPRGFLIDDEIFAMTFKQVFSQLWDKAKH